MGTQQATGRATPGCWVDVFDLSRYRGRRRRLLGPARFNEIRGRTQTWGIGIDSLLVGPGTYVRFYLAADPEAVSTWVLPRQAVPDMASQRIADDLDSVEVLDRPPHSGESGYAAYLAAIKLTSGSNSSPKADGTGAV
ncbi:MAG TPA: hypothetical protein VHD56_06535 [Tepidisphaeraceae bacterium]|nr:hypothetical protein [Tepidisphaeraceae bacterium]